MMDLECMDEQKSLVHHLISASSPRTLNMKNGKGQTLLHIAATQGNVELMRLAALHGADPGIRNIVGNTAVHEVCFLGDVALAKALLLPPTSQEMAEMKCLSHKYFRHRISSCLDYYTYSGQTALHIAVRSDNRKIVKLLLLSGADVDSRMVHSRYTALHIAVENNNEDMIKLLLSWKPDIHARTAQSFTAYDFASIRNEKIERMLKNAEPKKG